MDLKFTVKLDPVVKNSESEWAYVNLMDCAGTEFPKDFCIIADGTPGGFNDKGLGVTVETGPDGERIARFPLSKIGYAREIFAGVHRVWTNPEGKVCMDVMPAGECTFDVRLNLGTFAPEKMCKLIIG